MRKFLFVLFAVCLLISNVSFADLTSTEIIRMYGDSIDYTGSAGLATNVHGELLYGSSGIGKYLNWMEGRSTADGKWFFYVIPSTSNTVSNTQALPLILRPISADGYNKVRVTRFVSASVVGDAKDIKAVIPGATFALANRYITEPTHLILDPASQSEGFQPSSTTSGLAGGGSFISLNICPLPADKIDGVTFGVIPMVKIQPDRSFAAANIAIDGVTPLYTSGNSSAAGVRMDNLPYENSFYMSHAGTDTWSIGAAQAIVLKVSGNSNAIIAHGGTGNATEVIWVNLSKE